MKIPIPKNFNLFFNGLIFVIVTTKTKIIKTIPFNLVSKAKDAKIKDKMINFSL